MMHAYSCLRDARASVNVGSASNTSEDAYLLDALRTASARIEALTGIEFTPRIATYYQDALGTHIDTAEDVLYLNAPLLEVTSVTDGAGQALVQGTAFEMYPRNATPAAGLRIIYNSGYYWTYYTDDWRDAITVTGVWGHRSNYTLAWIASGDTVLGGGVNASATTITVSDADGVDAYNRTRFSPGQLLKVGNEYMTLLAVNTGTNTLTVVRGVQGSTATAHETSTAIYVWEPEPVIQRAALMWASYMLSRRGNFEQTQFDGMATVSYPADAPAEVTNILRDAGLLVTARRPI